MSRELLARVCELAAERYCMWNVMFDKFGLVTGGVKKDVVRYFYRDLTGDQVSSPSLSEQEVDERLEVLFDLEEPELLYDLRKVNPGRPCQFSTFWQKSAEFLEEDVGTAVDDCRHSQVIHTAKAISVCNFRTRLRKDALLGLPFLLMSYFGFKLYQLTNPIAQLRSTLHACR